MKKLIALMLCLGMLFTVVGCGNEEKKLEGNSIESVVAINEIDFSSDFYRYTLVGVAMQKAALIENFDGDFSKVDWSGLSEEIKAEVIDILKSRSMLLTYAKENNIKLTDEEENIADTMIENFEKNSGKGALATQLAVMGIKTKEGFIDAYKKELLCSKMLEEITQNKDKYIKDTDLSLYTSDDRASVKHILIMKSSTKYESPENKANEILALVKSGEDFDALIKEFNEDPGQTENGYTFGVGEMVKEFEEASFKLNINEVSDIVESEYGYHIIKRIVGETEISNYLKTLSSKAQISEAVNNLSIADIMNDVNNAMNTLNAESEEK